MGFAHDRDNASPAANELLSRNLVDLEAFRRNRDVVEGDVEGRRLEGEYVQRVIVSRGSCMVCSGDWRREVWSRTLLCGTGVCSTGACREWAGHLERRRPVAGPRQGS